MSAEAVLAVMTNTSLSDAEFRVLLRMAHWVDDADQVQVSVEEIAEKTGKSVRGVEGVLRRLWAAQYLVIVEEGGGRGRRNLYRVQP